MLGLEFTQVPPQRSTSMAADPIPCALFQVPRLFLNTSTELQGVIVTSYQYGSSKGAFISYP